MRKTNNHIRRRNHGRHQQIQEHNPKGRERTLRSITGHTLRDRIPNQEIRRICDIQDIVRLTRQRWRECNQHINRMEDNRIAKIARPPGRPPKRWRDSWMRRRKEFLKAGKTC